MAASSRIAVLSLGLVFVVGSAGTNQRSQPPPPAAAGTQDAPASRPMDVRAATGVWKSNFGPVKIQEDDKTPGHLMGVWVYDNKEGQEVIGFFSGPVDGNVLNFNWQEPSSPQPLRGSGYLQFSPDGRTYSGRWWTVDRSRQGQWNGWRTEDAQPDVPEDAANDGSVDGPAEQGPPPPPGPDDTDYL